MSRTALIYNPLSGSGRNREKIIQSVVKTFQDGGHQVSVYPTEHAAHATELAAEAAPFHDTILSAGGDGTAHEILQALVESHSPCALGVLPLGTGNVLATDLGLPLDAVAAARTMLTYKPRRIAVGRIESTASSGQLSCRYFTVAAGTGAHAKLIYAASAHAKSRGGMFVYYFTGFQSLFTHAFEPMRAVITKPNGEVIERSVVEAVAMRVSSFGGLLKRWRPGGTLKCNELRVILLTRGDRGALLRYALAAFAGRAQESAGIEFHSATRISCETIRERSAEAVSRVHVQADGEILGGVPITMSVVPEALSLLMPVL
jgi:diacylglycerol kinase (ATP)